MKKLTIISFLITIIGIVIPIINAIFFGIEVLVDIANFLIYSGLFLTYVFVISWQSQISKTRLQIVVVLSGFLILFFLIYVHIKLDESEKYIIAADENVEYSQKQLQRVYGELEENMVTIDSLINELEICK